MRPGLSTEPIRWPLAENGRLMNAGYTGEGALANRYPFYVIREGKMREAGGSGVSCP